MRGAAYPTRTATAIIMAIIAGSGWDDDRGVGADGAPSAGIDCLVRRCAAAAACDGEQRPPLLGACDVLPCGEDKMRSGAVRGEAACVAAAGHDTLTVTESRQYEQQEPTGCAHSHRHLHSDLASMRRS